MALPVLWDPVQCAAEIRRVAELGCHSITFTENPAALGFPSFHQEHWDPMWEALVDVGSILNIHLGSSGQLAVTAPDAPMDVMMTLQPMNICMAAADLVWSRVFKQFPTLKVALSEGGTGWIPYFLDRLDRTFDMHHAWTGQDFGDGRMPSDVFREHILTCFITDPVGIALRHEIGVDNICWEQDYPHSDSSWPTAPEEFHAIGERYARARRRDRQDDPRERDALVPVRPLRVDPEGAVHRRRAAGVGRRATTSSIRAMDQGRHASEPAHEPGRARRGGHRLTRGCPGLPYIG